MVFVLLEPLLATMPTLMHWHWTTMALSRMQQSLSGSILLVMRAALSSLLSTRSAKTDHSAQLTQINEDDSLPGLKKKAEKSSSHNLFVCLHLYLSFIYLISSVQLVRKVSPFTLSCNWSSDVFYLTETTKSRPNYHMQILLLCPQKMSLCKAAACMSMPSCPTTLKPKRNMSQSNNDDDNFNFNNCKEDEDEDCEAEYEVVEDLLEEYEKMKEEILSERMVSCTLFLAKYPSLTSTFSHSKTPPSRRRSMYAKFMGNV